MNTLTNISNTSNPSAVAQTNFQLLDASLAFMRQPSIDQNTQVATIKLGPPTAGTWVQYQLWVDAIGAVYVCTAGGTPGTWMQVQPAVVLAANKPVSSIPSNYLIRVPDGPWLDQYWNGSGWTTV